MTKCHFLSGIHHPASSIQHPVSIMPLTCPRCGGDVESHQPQAPVSGTLLACPYCSSTLYCRQGFCLSYEFIIPLLEANDAKSVLRRWFREQSHLVPLIMGAGLRHLPFWVITDEKGEKYHILAIKLPPGIPSPSLGEGQREPITLEMAAQNGWTQPSISLEAVTQGKSVQEALLIWAPFYWVTYKLKSSNYWVSDKIKRIIKETKGAWVDASFAGVSAGSIEPQKILSFKSPDIDLSASEPDFLPSLSSVLLEIPSLNLTPSGYGILGFIALVSALISFFSPHLMLSFGAIWVLALAAYLPLAHWGRIDEQ